MKDMETIPDNTGTRASVLEMRLPKLLGADVELGNSIHDESHPVGRSGPGTGYEAATALLREIHGLPAKDWHAQFERVERCPVHASETRSQWQPAASNGQASCTCGFDPQDWGRKFLAANGGCAYIDLGHLELCLPEVLSAFDHVACWHAMLRIARDAQEQAQARLPPGRRIQVLVNNSDGQGQSYGSHTSFLVAARVLDNLFYRKPHHLQFLASYLASSIVCTGAGKVGSENGRPAVGFQISQRADFFETLSGLQTTYRRPIVNARDESLAGRDTGMARLHCIFFDSTLCQVTSLLRVGVTQLVVAMLEDERVHSSLLLDDPLGAVLAWSHDPDLEAAARRISGRRVTAVELQWAFFEQASRFVATGRADGIVPRVHEIMALWEDTLSRLEADVDSLVTRLDWVLKRSVIEHALTQRGLGWDSPEAKHLDLVYSSLDLDEGLFWAYERKGLLHSVVTEAEIERFLREPPDDTRAWTRAHLLRRVSTRFIDSVDWDSMRFRLPAGRYWATSRTLGLPDPLGHTRAKAEAAFRDSRSLEELFDALEHSGAVVPEPAAPRAGGEGEVVLSPEAPAEKAFEAQEHGIKDSATAEVASDQGPRNGGQEHEDSTATHG